MGIIFLKISVIDKATVGKTKALWETAASVCNQNISCCCLCMAKMVAGGWQPCYGININILKSRLHTAMGSVFITPICRRSRWCFNLSIETVKNFLNNMVNIITFRCIYTKSITYCRHTLTKHFLTSKMALIGYHIIIATMILSTSAQVYQ
jgi:hypothetical protein